MRDKSKISPTRPMEDAADREPPGGHGHDHRIEASLLPLKKRASNYSRGGGRRSAAGNPYASSSSKKRRVVAVDVGAETKQEDTEAAPARRQRRPAPAPAPSSSPEPAAEGNAALSCDEKRLSKGKWLAKEDNSLVPQPAVKKKLMHDSIRSFIPQQHQQQLMSDNSNHHRHYAAAGALGPALERRLAELGATRPWLVLSKRLEKSDVDENQNRLLVSCKRNRESESESGAEDCPISFCFSPAEKVRVKNEDVGLCVTALDRGGAPFELTCKFLTSNKGYRLISQWKNFLIHNGMNLSSQRKGLWQRVVDVELWAFRSHQLPFQPQLDAAEKKVVAVTTRDNNGKKVRVVQRISHHLHPDGALGFLLLLHEKKKEEEEQEEEEEDDGGDWEGPSSVVRKKRKQPKSGKQRGASASASPLSDPAFYAAAIGLERLRRAVLDRWRQHAEGGHGAKGLSNYVAKSPADVEGQPSSDVGDDDMEG